MKDNIYQIEIDFQNPLNGKERTLSWDILNEDYAWIWIRELKILMQRQEPMYARFTGFNLSQKEKEKLFKGLNDVIEIINAEGLYKIKEKFTDRFDQEIANKIHHHFEVIYGSAHFPSELYRASSPLVQSAITKLNHYIHDLESMHRNIEDNGAFSAVVVEFLERRQFKLTTEMKESFSMDIDFGDIVAHYGIIGKSWWEAFLDKDEDIFLSGIRPLDVISGEFDIHFGQQRIDEKMKKEFYNFLREHNQDPNDSSLSLGNLCLGKLNSEFGAREIKEILCNYNKLAEIRLYMKGKLISQFDTSRGESTQSGFFRVRQECIVEESGIVALFHVPMQLIPIRGRKKGITKLCNLPMNNIYQRKGHIVTFMGTSDDNPVEFIPSDKTGGIRINRKIILYKGDLLHLAYDMEGHYLPMKGGVI